MKLWRVNYSLLTFKKVFITRFYENVSSRGKASNEFPRVEISFESRVNLFERTLWTLIQVLPDLQNWSYLAQTVSFEKSKYYRLDCCVSISPWWGKWKTGLSTWTNNPNWGSRLFMFYVLRIRFFSEDPFKMFHLDHVWFKDKNPEIRSKN